MDNSVKQRLDSEEITKITKGMTDRRMINAINRTKFEFWKIGGVTGACYVFTPSGHYTEFSSLKEAYVALVL